MKKLALFFSLINVFMAHSNAQDAVVAAEKMNVFYMGVDNPISIAVPNVSSDKLKVTGENVESINKQSDGHYIVRVARPGETTIIIEANGQITKKKFRAKSIPDPIPRISGVRSGHFHGSITNVNNFRAADGIITYIENFDFDARCSIQSFELIISPKKGEIFKTTVIGGTFSEEIKKRFQALEVGDVVNIFEIKTRCPGDPSARGVGSLTYTMK
jgi:GldM C-terminal domain